MKSQRFGFSRDERAEVKRGLRSRRNDPVNRFER
jgi:hypothetical protein